MTQPARPSRPTYINNECPCLEDGQTVLVLRSLRDDGPATLADMAARMEARSGRRPEDRLRVLAYAGLAVRKDSYGPGRTRGPATWTVTDLGRSALAALAAHERREGGPVSTATTTEAPALPEHLAYYLRAARGLGVPESEPIPIEALAEAAGCVHSTACRARARLRDLGRWPWPVGGPGSPRADEGRILAAAARHGGRVQAIARATGHTEKTVRRVRARLRTLDPSPWIWPDAPTGRPRAAHTTPTTPEQEACP